MARTSRLTGKDLIKILKSNGFEVARVRGSHHIVKHSDGRSTVVPVHGNEVIGIGLLRKISRDVEIDPLEK